MVLLSLLKHKILCQFNAGEDRVTALAKLTETSNHIPHAVWAARFQKLKHMPLWTLNTGKESTKTSHCWLTLLLPKPCNFERVKGTLEPFQRQHQENSSDRQGRTHIYPVELIWAIKTKCMGQTSPQTWPWSLAGPCFSSQDLGRHPCWWRTSQSWCLLNTCNVTSKPPIKSSSTFLTVFLKKNHLPI